MHYNGLELYASIEDMLDFSETVEKLYGAFYKKLKTFNNILNCLINFVDLSKWVL